ncbi:MAG: restriction endonuclease subunit S [Lachnospiraceae bacterium]|nr:restriction endonuclease subunit S [Lachnospiraceae bacterium]
MRKMKDSGVEWIGHIPENWELVQTKRHFQNIKRVVGEAVDEYERLALTMHGVIKRSKEDSDGLQPEKFEGYQILKTNELVFKLIDLENVKTSRVGLSPYTGLVSPAYIVLSNSYDDNRFFYYWFLFMYYNEIFNHLGGDGVRSSLNAKDLLALPIPNINVNLQKRIADYLDDKCSKIDALIEKQQIAIEKLKEYKLSVITEAVAPKSNWKAGHLGYIASFKNGLNYNGASEEKEIKFLGVGDFKQHFILNREDMFSTLKFSGYMPDDLLLKNGDIVFVRSNGSKELVGRSVLIDNVDFPLTYSGFCIRMRNLRQDLVFNEFLMYCFWSNDFRQNLNRDSRGSNINNLNQELLSKLRIAFPCMDEQKRIVNTLNGKCVEIENVILKKEKLISKLLEYKKSLIYEVMTGKREV